MSAIDREKLEQWLDAEIQNKDWPHEVRFGFLQVKKEIQSGAFDVDVRETEPQNTFSRAMLRELEKIEEYKRAKEDDGHEE